MYVTLTVKQDPKTVKSRVPARGRGRVRSNRSKLRGSSVLTKQVQWPMLSPADIVDALAKSGQLHRLAGTSTDTVEWWVRAQQAG